MAKKKYYPVRVGRKPGIYLTYQEEGGAQEQVDKYPGARYKGTSTLREALE